MKYKKARSSIELGKPGTVDKQTLASLEGKGLLIEQWNLDDLGADLTWCGRDGSPTKVHRIQSVVLKTTGYQNVEPTDKGIHDMVHELIEDHIMG